MLNNKKYFKLNNVYLKETYFYYKTIKILKIVLILIIVLTKVFNSIISGLLALFVLFTIIILHLIFKESTKKNNYNLLIEDEVLTIESNKNQKIFESSLNNIRKITFIFESHNFNGPNLTPNLVPWHNRILIEKNNSEKIHIVFTLNSYKEISNLKIEIQKIQSFYTFIFIKSALF